MRVLFLATDAYGGHGGIALCNRELISAITRHPRCEEVVVVPRIIPGVEREIPTNVTHVRAAAGGKAAFVREAFRWSRRGAYEIVICGHVNLLAIARLLPRPPVLMTHGIEAWKPLGGLGAAHLHGCRAVISVSELTRERLREWSGFAGPMHVLPNTIHAEQYGIREKRADFLETFELQGKRVLLTVGRLVEAERYKGFDEVIEVLPDLPADVHYLVAGGGDDAGRLRAKAAAFGVADRVHFTGYFEESDKADLYALGDVYVMPSRGEGFGFVFLEALASGLPVIGSRHDGGREALLGGKLGLLVDPSSPGELRQAILEQLEAPRQVPDGLEHFAFERFVERVHAIMEAIR